MAPEIWSEDSYNGAAADIFSCGVILFLLMTGFPPFYVARESKDAFSYFIAKKDYEAFWDTFEEFEDESLSDELKDLINSMLAFDPNERSTIEKIKSHPWFQGPVLDSEAMKKSMNSLKEKVNVFRFDSRQREKEEAAEAKALAKKMQEAKFSAPFAFTGVHVKKPIWSS